MDKISSLANMPPAGDGGGPPRKRSTDQLNEDMERMFENEGAKEDFSLSQLSSPAMASNPWSPGYDDDSQVREADDTRFHDSDIKYHRSDTFPHVHSPLKPQYRAGSRRGSRKSRHSESSQDADKHEKEEEEPETAKLLEKDDKDSGKEKKDTGVLFQIGDPEVGEGWSLGNEARQKDPTMESDAEEHSPLLSEVAKPKPIIRMAEPEPTYIDDSGRKKTRVQFDIGEEEQPDLEHRIRKKRSHKRRVNDTAEDPAWRRHLGSEHNLQSCASTSSAPTTEEEAMNLAEHDLDVMSSHRFDDRSAYRRPKVRARSSVSSIIHVSDKDDAQVKKKAKSTSDRQLPIMKKSYDHSPHEVFVELDELKYTEAGLQWKETARWIKYEENVEAVDNRWGKPHLAFLNFHALFSLRRGLEAGAVLLDLEERDLPSIAGRVVDKMIACDQIPADQREAVIRVLLLRHKHIRENQSSFRLPSLGSKSTLVSSDEKLSRSATAGSLDGGSLRSSVRKAGLSNLFHVNTFSNFLRHNSVDDATNVVSNGDVSKDNVAIKRSVSHESYTQIDIDGDGGRKDDVCKNKELMKKIPEGAEATAVLVGAVDFLKHPTIAFVRLAEGVMMDNLVEVPIPVRFMFVLLGPFHGEMDYHEVGRSISTLMSDKGFHEVAYRAHSRGQLLSAINEFLNASIVLPPTDWSNKDLVPVDEIQEKASQMIKKKESIRSKRMQAEQETAVAVAGAGDGGDKKPPPRDPLIRTGKPFYGLVQDIKIRYALYLSDLKDGLDGQVAAAAIFIFFAALSAAITFGGMYGDQTDNYVGVGETLLISAVNGLIFALFAAQPLLIVGATGPLMIFDMSLYSFAMTYELDFLSLRVWIGVWMTVFGLLVAAFEAVAIVKKMTRFTEEIFSTLVCIIFIYESFVKLGEIFKMHPLIADYGNITEIPTQVAMANSTISATTMAPINETSISGVIENGTLLNATDANGDEVIVTLPQPNTALLSFILMIGTFIIAFKLKHFRNSKYLGRSVRRALGDFGVPISIVLMVLLDYLIHDTYTDKLTMPAGIQPSNPEVRGWVINPFGETKPLPVWCIFMAAPASLLLFFLIFLEENICHLILSKPEKNMVKGSGFHWDIVLSCSINLISGLFGAPFMGPACVRTVSHTSALTVMSSTHAPGESPKIVGVKEQRLSAIVVSVLIGLSVLLGAVLNLVPKAVLFGIFLYMGISSTAGIQFLERLILVLMPVKHHPNVPYVKKVRTWKMHAFTGIQLLMIVILWIVKQSPAALCFPFVLMLLIPIRLYLLPYAFTNPELSALDGKEASSAISDPEDEPDFFEETHGIPTHVDHHHQS
ncbi:band 3 anion transport protein-like isoform X2 [Portunus trituberculatus]|uniref:band 3 anion transport protein-like isoform X2 n=1 Tax=Portunus trituberculatus TaxID=210409 RepID=UPI001E1CB3BF|nr:band 3 anion transport protein-like isoform X2 [Portunus trituberculatus]